MSRIFLSFAMYSVSISASDMASILGCEPDLAVIKGSERTPPRSRPTVHSWSIQEIDEIHDDLQGQLETILERMQNFSARIDDIRKKDPDLKVVLHIAVTPFSNRLVYYWSSPMIKTLASLDANIDLDFFSSDTADELQEALPMR